MLNVQQIALVWIVNWTALHRLIRDFAAAGFVVVKSFYNESKENEARFARLAAARTTALVQPCKRNAVGFQGSPARTKTWHARVNPAWAITDLSLVYDWQIGCVSVCIRLLLHVFSLSVARVCCFVFFFIFLLLSCSRYFSFPRATWVEYFPLADSTYKSEKRDRPRFFYT